MCYFHCYDEWSRWKIASFLCEDARPICHWCARTLYDLPDAESLLRHAKTFPEKKNKLSPRECIKTFHNFWLIASTRLNEVEVFTPTCAKVNKIHSVAFVSILVSRETLIAAGHYGALGCLQINLFMVNPLRFNQSSFLPVALLFQSKVQKKIEQSREIELNKTFTVYIKKALNYWNIFEGFCSFPFSAICFYRNNFSLLEFLSV